MHRSKGGFGVATPTSSGPEEQMSGAEFGPRVDTCSHVTGSANKLEGGLFFLVRFEYLQIGGTALRLLAIDIQGVGLRVQAGVAETPAGERICLTQPLKVYATLGQNLLYFDWVFKLIRVVPFLQILKHDVQEEGLDRIRKWRPAVYIVLVVVVHWRVGLGQILRFDARIPAALIFAPEQQIVACDLAPTLPGQGAYLRQLRVVLFSRLAESLQVLVNVIVREG